MSRDARGKGPWRMWNVTLVITEIDVVVFVLLSEIETQAHMLWADQSADVVDVVDELVKAGGVGARDEKWKSAGADHTASGGDGAGLIVGQIAWSIAESARIRMRYH